MTTTPGLWLSLRAADAPALITFLVDALGFEEVVVYRSDDGGVDHAELAWPAGGGVMLGSAGPGEPTGVAYGYMVTADPDAAFARATAGGATVVRSLTDTDYGSREFGVADPEGNRWSMGTYAGHGAAAPTA